MNESEVPKSSTSTIQPPVRVVLASFVPEVVCMWRILRARRLSDTARATLGVAVTASQPEIKQAYRALAKEWHPDLHPGASKARAEEKFKAIKQAYEALAAAGVGGAAAGGAAQRQAQRQSRHRFRARRPQQSAAFTFTSYLGFRGRHGHSHWYEDTAHAAERVDAQRARRMWAGVGTFILGLAAINLSAARDRRLKASGDLVDAWFNQATRRWETPPPHMHKDALMSTAIHLKPPHTVYRASSARGGRRAGATRTLDGSTAEHSYLARQRGDKT